MGSYKLRRLIVVCVLLLAAAIQLASLPVSDLQLSTERINQEDIPASLAELPVKGRAPKTGYQRRQFGNGWETRSGCDTRNIILARDLQVMDASAISLARQSEIPILVFSIFNHGAFAEVMQGKGTYTIVE